MRSLISLLRCEKGSAFPLIAATTLAMIGAAGAAVDMGRIHMVQSRLSSALDAAGLAAGAAASTVDITAEVTKYMNVNFPSGYMGSTLTSLSATPDADNQVISLAASATLDMTFMQIFGHDSVTVHATSEITRTSRGMELVLVLDITGSMWSGSKHIQLREAATSLINILYGSKSEVDNLWVGMVPYVTAVNIGSQSKAQEWLTSYDLTQYPANYPAGETKWKGCVMERATPLDTSDDIPVAGSSAAALATRFPMWFWPDTDAAQDNNWIDDTTGAVTIYEAVDYQNTGVGGGLGPNISCGEPVMAFTTDKTTILNKIGALYPWRKSGTMSNVGLAWGWRMLSPKWRGLWDHVKIDGQDKLPFDYDKPLLDKVVVIETDGENQFYDTISADPFYSDYSPFGRLNTTANGGRADINTQSQGTGRARINEKTLAICTAMKAQGILIYTVTFNLGTSTAHTEARNLFRSCASKPEYYFDANSGVPGATPIDLNTAFKQIGDSLANLHISH